jgi:hypothetical protein
MRGHNTTEEGHDLEAIARSLCHGSECAASRATRNALPFSVMAVRAKPAGKLPWAIHGANWGDAVPSHTEGP